MNRTYLAAPLAGILLLALSAFAQSLTVTTPTQRVLRGEGQTEAMPPILISNTSSQPVVISGSTLVAEFSAPIGAIANLPGASVVYCGVTPSGSSFSGGTAGCTNAAGTPATITSTLGTRLLTIAFPPAYGSSEVTIPVNTSLAIANIRLDVSGVPSASPAVVGTLSTSGAHALSLASSSVNLGLVIRPSCGASAWYPPFNKVMSIDSTGAVASTGVGTFTFAGGAISNTTFVIGVSETFAQAFTAWSDEQALTPGIQVTNGLRFTFTLDGVPAGMTVTPFVPGYTAVAGTGSTAAVACSQCSPNPSPPPPVPLSNNITTTTNSVTSTGSAIVYTVEVTANSQVSLADSLTLGFALSGVPTDSISPVTVTVAMSSDATSIPRFGPDSLLANPITIASAWTPVPTIASLTPSTIAAGASGYWLTVNGWDFAPNAVVKRNGSSKKTRYIDSTRLLVYLLSYDLANNGTAQIAVTNPTPGGGTSSPATLTIGCAASLSTSLAALPIGGGTVSVSVTAPSYCGWHYGTEPTYASWIAAIGTADRAGNGTATFTVGWNPPGPARAATLTVAGQPVSITQAANCNFILGSLSRVFTPAAGSSIVNLAAADGSCTWNASSNVPWITITSGRNGGGNGTVYYSVGANPLAASRSGTLNIAGFAFTVTQDAAATAATASITAASGHGVPGGTAQIPVALSVASGAALTAAQFSLTMTPIDSAPPLIDLISFAAAGSTPPATADTGSTTNQISVSWASLAPPISGNSSLGTVTLKLPATAQAGQSYLVRLASAGGATESGGALVALGPDANVLVSPAYLVGDAAPALATADQNADGTSDEAGEFGDGRLDIVDLILALRAVTHMPGYTPPSCSDRFDTIDAFPKDTDTVRGGDGHLDILDLITTLRRVTGLDSSRPSRNTFGAACTASVNGSAQPASVQSVQAAGRRAGAPGSEYARVNADLGVRATGSAHAAIEFGQPETATDGGVRVPVYLHAKRDLNLAGLSFSLGLAAPANDGNAPAVPARPAATLRFTAESGFVPSLTDNAIPGLLALAWLDPLLLAPSQRVLLGYVEFDRNSPADFVLEIYGVSANDAQTGAEVPILSPSQSGVDR